MEGVKYVGWRKSAAPPEFREECIKTLDTFLEAARPRGAGGVDFLSSHGIPYLSDMNTGRFNGAHVPLMFRRAHAPDAEFFCFRSPPFLGLKLKTLWPQLEAEGVCYHPSMGPTGRGVFPVMFWEGQASVWVALGDSQAHCMDLYQRTIPFLGTERGMLAKISNNFDVVEEYKAEALAAEEEAAEEVKAQEDEAAVVSDDTNSPVDSVELVSDDSAL